MKKQKVLATLLAAVMTMSMAACGSESRRAARHQLRTASPQLVHHQNRSQKIISPIRWKQLL